MLSEHIYYNNDTYIDLWITYANYCGDDVEVLLYLHHKGICNLNWKMCYHIGKCYEKRNCFDKANEYYLKGIEIGKDNNDIINEYKEFECRMEKRVLKEINEASISIMEIKKGIMEEIERMNGEEYNDKNKRMKRCDKGKHSLILYNFKIKEDKIEINDHYYNDTTTVSKGTKLVEIYNIVVNYLSNNDCLFKEKQQSVEREIKERLRRKPYSWISSKRNIKINYSNICDEVNYLVRNNYQIGSETKSVISPSQKTFEAIDFFENEVSKKSYEKQIKNKDDNDNTLFISSNCDSNNNNSKCLFKNSKHRCILEKENIYNNNEIKNELQENDTLLLYKPNLKSNLNINIKTNNENTTTYITNLNN